MKLIEGKPYKVWNIKGYNYKAYYAGTKNGQDWFWHDGRTKYTIFDDRIASFPEHINNCTLWDNWEEIKGVDYERCNGCIKGKLFEGVN